MHRRNTQPARGMDRDMLATILIAALLAVLLGFHARTGQRYVEVTHDDAVYLATAHSIA